MQINRNKFLSRTKFLMAQLNESSNVKLRDNHSSITIGINPLLELNTKAYSASLVVITGCSMVSLQNFFSN